MARTRKRLSPASARSDSAQTPDASLPTMLEKAHAVAAKVARLTRDFAGAQKLAQAAQVREALTRAELTEALHAALAARSDAERRLRASALGQYRARGGVRSLRRHNRVSQMLDRGLARLGSLGQALVIARSGVWRGTGRPLHDLRHMAAYARRRANPAVAPPALLDQAWYLTANPDVAASRTAPLVHYLVSGAREGRDPHPLFHQAFYARENAQVLAATSLSPLEHFVRAGSAMGRNPHPLFDVAHYLAQAPALAPGEDALSHYLREGGDLGLSPHPLFDPDWYAAQVGAGTGRPSLTHYLTSGWRSGLSPHPLFDPAWYLARNPQVAGSDPLVHFLMSGAAEGCSPGPWFDLPAYLAQRGAGLPAGENPLVDYLQGGAWAVAEPRPSFATAAYLAARPDLASSGLTPLEHWARRAGR